MITLNEALEEAKGYLEKEDKRPSFPTIYRWAKTGVISEPIDRENKGKAGGMKDLYPLTLPLEIAVTCCLLASGFSLKRITQVRQVFIEAQSQGEGLHEAVNDLDSGDAALREYVYHYYSLPYQKVSSGRYRVLISADGEVSVSKSEKRLLSVAVPLSGEIHAAAGVKGSLTVVKGGKDK